MSNAETPSQGFRVTIEEELASLDLGNKTVPFGTYNTLAKKYKLSREWVRRIAESNDYAIAKEVPVEHFCRVCGKVRVKRRTDSCEDCRYVSLTCDFCGKTFKRLRSQLRDHYDHIYCSRTCLGFVAGASYGRKRGKQIKGS